MKCDGENVGVGAGEVKGENRSILGKESRELGRGKWGKGAREKV